jgi:hypothetical protein
VYSVTFSQRLFGEAVLGLSQVSSLYTVYSVTFSLRLFGKAEGYSGVLTGEQLVHSVLCNLLVKGSSGRLFWGLTCR